MARVSATEVGQIYAYDSSISDADVDVFILSANILVNNVNTIGEITDATTLKEIERWLSAHLVAIRDPQSAREKAGPVSQTLQQKVDLNFNQTRYGQQALLLDTSGYLASLQKQAKGDGGGTASFSAMGPQSDEQIAGY